MKKKTWSKITYIYLLAVGVAFTVFAFNVADENWNIDFDEHKNTMYWFLVLSFIGVVLTAVDLAGVRDKNEMVSKRVVYSGLSLGGFFVIWRLLMTLN